MKNNKEEKKQNKEEKEQNTEEKKILQSTNPKNPSKDRGGVVPELRFPEFSEEWEKKKLGEMAKIIMGQSPKGDSYNTEGIGSPLINGPVEFTNRYPIKIKWTSEPTKFCQDKDILFCVRGSTTGRMNISNGKYCIGRGVAAIRQKDKKSNSEFIEASITKNLQKILSLTAGSTFVNLDSNSLREFKMSFPTLSEQTKIANFLSAVDKRIENGKLIIDNLRLYKRGLMQQIFSQKLRFKDENGQNFPDWEEKRLGDLTNITTGKLDANAMKDNGIYRFYTCAKEFYFIDKYAFDTEALLISGNGANVGYIHYYKGKFNAYQRTYVLDSFSENIIYIKYFLGRHLRKRIMRERNEGNTPYIVLGTLSNFKIQLPSLPEQKKIADFLSALDKKIENEKMKLENLKEWKKGLLQKMFV